MRLLVKIDAQLHRLMKGRCYNRRLCLKLSYWDAMHLLSVWYTSLCGRLEE